MLTHSAYIIVGPTNDLVNCAMVDQYESTTCPQTKPGPDQMNTTRVTLRA